MSSGLQYGCSKRARCSGRALSLTSSFLLRFAGVFCGALGRTRTCDLLIRSQTLYPTELRAHEPCLQPIYDTYGVPSTQGVG